MELDDWMCLSIGQLNLGNIALLLDETEDDLQAFERAESNAQKTGNAMIEAMAVTGRAVISLNRGEPRVDLLMHAIDLIEGIDVHVERLGALVELTVHQVWQEEFADAERTLVKAWRVALHVNEDVWLATIAHDAARMRVYTSIRRLRKLGLEDWIITVDDGYRIHDELYVEFVSQLDVD